MRFTKVLLVLVFGLIYTTSTASECSIELEDVLVLKDSSGELSIEEVLRKTNDFKFRETLNFGYTQSAYWVLLPSVQKCDAEDVFVCLQHPSINFADFYLLRGDSIIDELHTGTLRPNSSGRWSPNKIVYRLPGKADPTFRLFIRLQNEEGSLKTEISILGQDELFKANLLSNLVMFIFLGVVLMQLLYALIQFFTYKEKMFLWYSGLVICTLLFGFFGLQYGHLILPELLVPFSNTIRFLPSLPGLAFLLLFCYQLLDVEVLFSRPVQVFFKAQIVFYGLWFFLLFLPLPAYPVRWILMVIFHSVFVATLITILATAWNAGFKKGHQPAYYFLVVQTPIVAVFFVYLLRNYGIIPEHSIFQYLVYFAVLFEVSVSLLVMTVYYKRKQLARLRMRNLDSGTNQEIKPDTQPDEDSEQLFPGLKKLIEDEKIYLQKNLKIADIAEQLGASSHLVSKTMNQCGNMHFFDFVNSYRVNYAKELLLSEEFNEKYTIEAIGLECGFSNRASFNSAFKKFTDSTPSAFRSQRQS